MKTASEIIGEMAAEHASRQQSAAEVLKMLDWLFEQLNSTEVSVKFNGLDIYRVSEVRDGQIVDGHDVRVQRYGRLLCELTPSNIGVWVIPEDRRLVEHCWDGERALRRVLEILRADFVMRPQDDRELYEPEPARI